MCSPKFYILAAVFTVVIVFTFIGFIASCVGAPILPVFVGSLLGAIIGGAMNIVYDVLHSKKKNKDN